MRKLSLLIGLLICFVGKVSAQEEIHWMSMDEALAAQKKEPKKIFMDAYTDWCGPCKLMEKKTFHNEDVINYINKHYYAVKFNAEGREKITYHNFTYTNPKYDPERKGKRNYQHLFAHALKIQGYPCIVFFDKKSDVIQPVIGYQKPKELEIYLKMVASDDYKNITTQKSWEKYQKNFKHTFEN